MKVVKVFFSSLVMMSLALGVQAEVLSYKGDLTVMKGEQVLTYPDVEFEITINEKTMKADFSTRGIRFGDRMPAGLNIVFGGVDCSVDCGVYSFESEVVKPVAGGKPYGSATFTDLSGYTGAKTFSMFFNSGRVMAQYEGELQ